MYTYKARVISVYDGDTVRADIDLGFGVIFRNQQIRLHGINAPEVRGKSRPEGLASRDALRERLDGAGYQIVIKTHKDSKEKYGRWLGELFIGNENLNQWLVKSGFALEYMA